MDSTVTHFIQLLAWLALALGLFGIGRLAIACLEKTVLLDKWFDHGRPLAWPSSRTRTTRVASSAKEETLPYAFMPSLTYHERWHKEDVDDLGRANSFLGTLFFVLALFYVDDIGHRFPLSGPHAKDTLVALTTLVGATCLFSFGWASQAFRTRWGGLTWFRTLLQSMYMAAALFCFVYLSVGAGEDWPLFLVGLGVYGALVLVAYVCFVRHHSASGSRRRFGYDFWSLSYLLCLVNLQHDLVANLLYALCFAHFMVTASRYQPPRLFYPMYSSSVPAQ